MPWLEELDTQGMMQQSGTGESWGASRCFLPWLPPRSHARLLHSVFLFHLKNHLLSAPTTWAEWLSHDAIAPFYFIFYSNLIPASLCPGFWGWFCFLIEVLCCATLSNQIPSLSVKQDKHILGSCSVPLLSFATNS